MFERYTEKARRVIFFARYEASQFGSPYIETEHLLLGFLREDKGLSMRVIRELNAESIREEIESATLIREKVSTSVDLPLSNESTRVLAYAAEEAERLNHKHVGTEHLLLGLLRENKGFAACLLEKRGVTLESTRALIRENSGGFSDMGLGAVAAGSVREDAEARSETRVVLRRVIVFQNEADGANLGETFSIDVPRVGDEIALPEFRGRVTRVSYHYVPIEYVIHGSQAILKPDKIVVHVRPLET